MLPRGFRFGVPAREPRNTHVICFTWDSDGVAIITEELIAKCLYSRLGSSFEEHENWTLIYYSTMRRGLG